MTEQRTNERLRDAKAEADWPAELRAICRDRCAEMGEPACWQVDESINPDDPDRGTVCAECRADYESRLT